MVETGESEDVETLVTDSVVVMFGKAVQAFAELRYGVVVYTR